jgi:hypothetical protein
MEQNKSKPKIEKAKKKESYDEFIKRVYNLKVIQKQKYIFLDS